MRREDARGRRVAIVADILVNPGSALYGSLAARPGPVLDVLVEDGWGIMKAPPHVLGLDAMASAIATLAGDAADYLKHRHAVVIVAAGGAPEGGLRLDMLAREFGTLRAEPPPIVVIGLDEDSTGQEIRRRLETAVA